MTLCLKSQKITTYESERKIKLARITCDFYSEILSLSTSMTVILPQAPLGENKNRKYPTLYLLHGFSDDHTNWTRRTSIERYAEEAGIAVVMPQADHSFYTDMAYGKKYWTFLTEEVPHVARAMFPLSDKREDNFVAGLSMGGYGAFKWALRYPERFAAAASLSGALDIEARVNKAPAERTAGFHHIFGEKEVAGTNNDLLWLIDQGDKTADPKPLLYQCCGTEDFLYEENIKFQQVCEASSYKLTTSYSAGAHEWGYWDRKIQDVLAWLPLA